MLCGPARASVTKLRLLPTGPSFRVEGSVPESQRVEPRTCREKTCAGLQSKPLQGA